MFEAFERSLEKISSLNVKAIELAFPTVIYNASCGALFSYNIESGWLYDSKCPSDCCWSTITTCCSCRS